MGRDVSPPGRGSYDRGSRSHDADAESRMDALADILKAARLSGGVFFRAEFSAPWCLGGLLTPEMCAPFVGRAQHLVPYHFLVDGEIVVSVNDEPARVLRGGEVVLFPRNEFHVMASDRGLTPVPPADVVLRGVRDKIGTIRYGGSGKTATFVCGYLGCDHLLANPVISSLPPMMVLRIEDSPAAAWIRSTFEYGAHEAAAGRQGSSAVLAKLAELLFVGAVREHLQASPPERTGWLAGLRDPAISRVLALMHGDVAYPWSVEELGRKAGISRSSLADHFNRLLGVSPMHYLADWRLQMAGQMLRESTDPLARVAERIGYESEAAFSRAFKKKFGQAPASWRRSESPLHPD
jgi:AraC-like DNA-binding protein